MATPLKDRIEALSVILTGPILRRTTPDAVTVWIALKTSCNVTLTVFRYDDDSKTPILQSSSTSTVKLGEYLHVIAVTAKSESGQKIQAGIIYCYDLILAGGDLPTTFFSLASAYPNGELSYLPNNLPSFALQPKDIDKLRLFHASCRKPHAEGRDALPILDDLIKLDAAKPDLRPHLLFLTGDQIYADDVAKCLSPVLVDAANTLLGWVEQIPAIENGVDTEILLNKFVEVPIKRDVGPYVLAQGVNGFTSTAASCHLFGLGEFYAMYLLTWSDVLWPPENELLAVDKDQDELKRVQSHRETLSKVRRALANIPTYMMFDDHEVTDDWFLSREVCNNLLTSRLGQRVLQNALAAYAVFQAWGNSPERFASGTGGEKLLKALEVWHGDLISDQANNKYGLTIASCLGIPGSFPSEATSLKPDPSCLRWDYQLQLSGYEYEILVLNTRTMRSYSTAQRDSPALLSNDAIKEQIPSTAANCKLSIIVSPAPLFDIPIADLKVLGLITNNASSRFFRQGWLSKPYVADLELWEHNNHSLQSLFTALFARNTRLVLLAGDVHYGYAVRLGYSATYPYGTAQAPTSRRGVLAMLISSPLKNEDGLTHKLHWAGWELAQSRYITKHWIGWRTKPKYATPVKPDGDILLLPRDQEAPPYKLSTRKQPFMLEISELSGVVKIRKPPDWRYRLDFILGKNQIPPNIVERISENLPADSMEALHVIEKADSMLKETNDKWGSGKEVVGVNHIAEVKFSKKTPDDVDTVTQTLYWRLSEELPGEPLSIFEVSLNPNDPNFGDLALPT